MTSNIFANFAPNYWKAGLPVIPLKAYRPKDPNDPDDRGDGKEPIPYGWQRFHETMPTEKEQAYWLATHPNSNIGLPLGVQSGVVAMDIDTLDATLQRIITSVLPPSPWVRIGAKGMVLAYKFSGHKTFRIKDSEGKTICELLSSKTQIVVPPSIHPSTGLPYNENCPLWDVVNGLPELHQDIEHLLRTALQEEGGVQLSISGWTKTTEWVSQGSRDVKMTSMAGFFANGVLRGELSLKEALSRLNAWNASCVERISGDEVDIAKGEKLLVNFLINDVLGPKGKTLPKGWDDELTAEEKTQLGLNFDEVHQEWDIHQIKDYLVTEFEKHSPGSPQSMEAINYILRKMAKSPKLSSLDEGVILRYITQINSKEVSITNLRKYLQELRSDGLVGNDHTEIAKATQKELSKVSEVRFHQDGFYRWGGSHWEKLDQQDILRTIAEEFGNLPAARKANDHMGIMRVLRSILPQGLMYRETSVGVNFVNGYLDKDLTLYQHSPSYGVTYTLPFRYLGPQTLDNCPRFRAYLQSVWGTHKDYAEKVKALQEAIAVTLFGQGPSFARAILLHGIGGSGKTQLLQIVKQLIPNEIISYVTPYKFADKFEVTELAHSLLNICGELEEEKPIPGANFKQIIDGSEMNGQYKGQQIFSFKPRATHWFASNHLPKSRDATQGFNRRWLVLTFDRIISKEEKVRDIGNMIVAEEREQIVSWAVSCMPQLASRGDMTLPSSHFAIMEDVANENDSLAFYLTSEDGPRKTDPNYSIPVTELYEGYMSFCYGTAHAKPVGLRKFLNRLKELGILMGFGVSNTQVLGLILDRTDVGEKLERQW